MPKKQTMKSTQTQIQRLIKEYEDNRDAIIALGREIGEKQSQMVKLLEKDNELYSKLQELHTNEVSI